MRYDDRLETIMNARTRDAGARWAMWSQLVDVLAQDRGAFPPELRDNAYRWLEKWRAEVPEKRRASASASLAGRAVPADLVDFFARDTASVAGPVLTGARVDAAAWSARLPAWPASSRALLQSRSDLDADLSRALASLGPSVLALPSASVNVVQESATPSLPPLIDAFPPLAEEPMGIPRAENSPMATEEDILDLPIEAALPPEEPAQIIPETITAPVAEPEPAPAMPDRGVRPIGALLERIERYRKDNPGAATSARNADRPATAFVFEADRSGLISWVDGAPRGALIGQSIAEMALPGECGVDGQAAGAFRKRARFDHARMHVAGHGPAAGDWLISGEPVFEPEGGRFLGYQGQARRLVSDAATDAPGELLGGAMRPASVRQLVHELRTPLNAIRGFAEMIEGQFLGPVSDPYRKRAEAIMRDSASLLRVFEDLESAARLESGDYPLSPTARTNIGDLARDVLRDSGTMSASAGPNLGVVLPEHSIEAAVDDVSSRRLIAGFVDLLAGVAHAEESIGLQLVARDGVALIEARPEAGHLAGWDWSATVADEPGRRVDVLPLGLGYKFRLLARLADRVGGGLHATADRLSLLLPLASATEGQTKSV